MFMLGSGDTLICGRINAATGEVSGIVNEYRAAKYRTGMNVEYTVSQAWSDEQAGIALHLSNGEDVQILVQKPDQGSSAEIRAYWNT